MQAQVDMSGTMGGVNTTGHALTPGRGNLLNASDVFKYQEETKKLILDLREELRKTYEENDMLNERLRGRMHGDA